MAIGHADEFSDIDLLAVSDDLDHAGLIADWPGLCAQITPVVLRQQHGEGTSVVFSHITPAWLRFDITIGVTGHVPGRPRNLVTELFDRDGLTAQLGPDAAPRQPDPATVEYLITEFWRVMGLLPVVVGRDDLLVAVSGSALIRTLLIKLLLEDVAVADRGGALHLERLLPAAHADLLRALPPIRADVDSAIAVHLACVGIFLPVARNLAARTGVAWPTQLEAAARGHLVRELGLHLPQ